MMQLTQEWVDKAEGDYRTAMRESVVLDDPNYNAACYHAQQCAEKYIKARLQYGGVKFDYIHNLVALLKLAEPIEPSWATLEITLQTLTAYAVSYRYPGPGSDNADQMEAQEAVKLCAEVRAAVRLSLGLP